MQRYGSSSAGWPACLISACPFRKEGSTERDRRPHTIWNSSEYIRPMGPDSYCPLQGPMQLYHPFPIAICWWEPARVRCVHTCTANMWDNRAPRPLPWTKTSRRPPNSPLIPRLSSDSATILQIDCRKSCFIPVLCSKLEKQGFSKSPNVRLQNGLWHVWPVSYQGVAFKELMLKSPP